MFITIMKKTEIYQKSDVQIIKKKKGYQGFLAIEQLQLKHRLFNKTEFSSILNREFIDRKDAAGVLIYNHQHQKFALIEQFRVGAINDPVSPWQLEVIAGIIDEGESAETCILRESIEEANCHIRQIQHLFTFYPSAGACSERFFLYAAEADLPEDGSTHGLATEGEDIKLHIFDYSELPQLLQHPQVSNAAVIIALQWLTQYLAK